MENQPLISVVIPSFNQGNFIRQTIDSILEQSHQEVEIIVIDGGSTDGTLEVLQSYGNRIFWVSEKDRGQTHAINKGIAMTKGEIVAYLNSDDYYLDNTLEKIQKVFYYNPNVQWVSGDYIIVDEVGFPIQSAVAAYKNFWRSRLSFSVLSILNPVIQPSTFLRKSFLVQIGTFNEELRYTMDYDYWMRAIQVSAPLILKDKLSAFRIHGNSKGGSQYRQQFAEELKVAKRYQKKTLQIFLHKWHNFLIELVYRIIK